MTRARTSVLLSVMVADVIGGAANSASTVNGPMDQGTNGPVSALIEFGIG